MAKLQGLQNSFPDGLAVCPGKLELLSGGRLPADETDLRLLQAELFRQDLNQSRIRFAFFRHLRQRDFECPIVLASDPILLRTRASLDWKNDPVSVCSRSILRLIIPRPHH